MAETALAQPRSKWLAHDEALKRLWLDGVSASDIAAQLGAGITRNGVIGRLDRMGLIGKGGRATRKKTISAKLRAPAKAPTPEAVTKVSVATARIEPAIVAPIAAALAIIEAEPPAAGAGISILQLRDGLCRWLLGDPRAADFCYCGAPTRRPLYCEAHHAISYEPPKPRKSRGKGR